MASEHNLINEQIAAQQTLLAGARRVSAALPTFSTWLMAGFGAAFTLALVNIETVSKFIEITHIRFGLVLFLVSLVLAVLGTYLGTIVTAALAAHEDGELIGKKISESKQKFDLSMFAREYERGLFPPIRWVAHSAMKKAMHGDVVAGARMIAKLSQLQTLMVVAQGVLAVVAAGALAVGLKMQ
jgi:hypothetical protein